MRNLATVFLSLFVSFDVLRRFDDDTLIKDYRTNETLNEINENKGLRQVDCLQT